MSNHSVERTSRGEIVSISGSCGSDECPIEDVDDDGTIEYTCPVTGDVIVTVDPVDNPADPDGRTPDPIDSIVAKRRKQNRRRRRRKGRR